MILNFNKLQANVKRVIGGFNKRNLGLADQHLNNIGNAFGYWETQQPTAQRSSEHTTGMPKSRRLNKLVHK